MYSISEGYSGDILKTPLQLRDCSPALFLLYWGSLGIFEAMYLFLHAVNIAPHLHTSAMYMD
jgi:hypothetical protein